jgi:hypothetical protein
MRSANIHSAEGGKESEEQDVRETESTTWRKREEKLTITWHNITVHYSHVTEKL